MKLLRWLMAEKGLEGGRKEDDRKQLEFGNRAVAAPSSRAEARRNGGGAGGQPGPRRSGE